MAKDNAQSSFQRGVMSLLILSLLDQEDMYGYQIVQEISAPAGIAFSGVMRHTLPSASSAQRSIPSDIMPASLAGFRLVRTITFIPMVSSGL